MKKSKVRVIALAVAFILFAAAVFFTAWGNLTVKTTVINIDDENIPKGFDGFKIAQISDFHNTELGKDNSKIIKVLQKQQPDIIVITGDFVDSSHTDFDIALSFAKKAVKIAPCYYVSGNHEAWLVSEKMGFKDFKHLFVEAGITVLENETKIIERNGDKINLIGINDPSFEENEMFSPDEGITEHYIESAGAKDGYKILLAHRPELFETYVRENMNLVFSGHAHGGQIRLPFIGGLIAPNQGLFPKYDAGLYEKGNTKMIVSRGLGNSVIPLRFNNRPEIVIALLKK